MSYSYRFFNRWVDECVTNYMAIILAILFCFFFKDSFHKIKKIGVNFVYKKRRSHFQVSYISQPIDIVIFGVPKRKPKSLKFP